MKQMSNTKPSPQSQCEVCRAARELVQASDGLSNARPETVTALRARYQTAESAWKYAKDGRHTGPVHTPVVEPVATRPYAGGEAR